MKNRSRQLDINAILMRTVAVLLMLVLVSTGIVSGRYARYITTATAEDSARVAAFVFDVNDAEGHTFDLSSVSKPGDSVRYAFEVTNKNGSDRLGEVTEEYQITLDLVGSLPLVCALTDGQNSIQVEGASAQATSAKTTFQAAVESSVTYELIVKWPENENNIMYANAGIASLVMTIAAQQVD